MRLAEKVYKVPQTTIRRRRDGTRPRRDCEPNSKRLTKLEEEVIIQRILNKSLRSVPPLKAHVRDIANRLLRERIIIIIIIIILLKSFFSRRLCRTVA